MKALILVDVQNDFLPGGALAVPRGEEIIPVLNRLQRLFDLVVATQDWHPPDHESFAVMHPGANVGDLIELNGLPQRLWPVHCVQQTAGAAFAPNLDMTLVTEIFQKGVDRGIDSYSGFFDNGHRRSTGLHDFLQGRKVKEVFVAGLATDYCVKSTALDAVALEYETFVLEDASRGVDLVPGDVHRALEEMRLAGVTVTRSY
jgi:nicotinamidase/pyrazinamidase